MNKVDELIEKIVKETLENRNIKGLNQYSNKKLEYPECYAFFIKSLKYLYLISKNSKYKEEAAIFIEILFEMAYEDSEEMWWGLPFNWGKTCKEDGFLITTIFCFDAIKEWDEIIEIKKIDKMKKILNYVFSLVNKEKNGINYSKKLKTHIYNASSLTVGVLSKYNEILNNNQKLILFNVANNISTLQKDGYWNYSASKCDVDLLHQCYTCEGLLEYGKNNKNSYVLSKAIQGTDFIINKMQYKEMERYIFRFTDLESLNTKIKYLILRGIRFMNINSTRFHPPRAWSLAAMMRLLISTYQITNDKKYLKELKNLIDHIEENIIKNNSIKFSKISEENYIRNTYHMLYSLLQYKYFLFGEKDE